MANKYLYQLIVATKHKDILMGTFDNMAKLKEFAKEAKIKEYFTQTYLDFNKN